MGMLDFSVGDLGGLATGIREAITGEKIKDPVEMAKIALDAQKLEQALLSGQIEINKEEAKHSSIFVAGWRPAIGWVCALSLALMYIPRALVMTYIWTYKCYVTLSQDINAVIPTFPDLGAMDIIGLMGSLLGIATLRTVEKAKKVSREGLK